MDRKILDPRRYLPGGVPEFRQTGILATFPEADAARRAAAELAEAGYGDVQLDEVSARPSQGGTLRSGFHPETLTGEAVKDRRILAAADPALSGNARGEDLVGGHRYLLTVATEPDRFDPALRIIRKHGGDVDGGGPR